MVAWHSLGMDVAQLPFNQYTGIRVCESKEDGIFELAAEDRYMNHLGTVHAAAIYGLAEATSEQFLADRVRENEGKVFPVLRRAVMKYSRPAEGSIYATVTADENQWNEFHETLDRRNRAFLPVQVDVLKGFIHLKELRPTD